MADTKREGEMGGKGESERGSAKRMDYIIIMLPLSHVCVECAQRYVSILFCVYTLHKKMYGFCVLCTAHQMPQLHYHHRERAPLP